MWVTPCWQVLIGGVLSSLLTGVFVIVGCLFMLQSITGFACIWMFSSKQTVAFTCYFRSRRESTNIALIALRLYPNKFLLAYHTVPYYVCQLLQGFSTVGVCSLLINAAGASSLHFLLHLVSHRAIQINGCCSIISWQHRHYCQYIIIELWLKTLSRCSWWVKNTASAQR